MKQHKVKITETYTYEIDIEADNQNKAVEMAKEYYKSANDGVTGVADARSFEGVLFKILKSD